MHFASSIKYQAVMAELKLQQGSKGPHRCCFPAQNGSETTTKTYQNKVCGKLRIFLIRHSVFVLKGLVFSRNQWPVICGLSEIVLSPGE
jgi:hypothetical protein